jgi:ABC-type transport system substrate-binding protein
MTSESAKRCRWQSIYPPSPGIITAAQSSLIHLQLKVSDPEMDSFYPRAIKATTEAEVKKILIEANEYVARQHFAISLMNPVKYSIAQPWLKGYTGQFCSISRSA